ncbi:FG-GAP and VCBS repeat-containing protein [Streptomyces sp. NPDC047108]|uniref:FG-GAP repeat domain-containing protein n=1 Tax=Streptomyces sp. NPDC047108 TaxID=3155025 RepID=UPI0033D48F2F
MRIRTLATAVVCAGALLAGTGCDGGGTATGDGAAGTARPDAATASPAGAGSASAKKRAALGDFDGDGYRDLAVSGWRKPRTGADWTRYRAAVPGSADGVRPEKSAPLRPLSRDTAEKDRSGEAPWADDASDRLQGDLDRDGYADLVVPRGPKGGSGERTSAVSIRWGGPRGLDESQGTAVEGPEPDALGDFDGDGWLDLVSPSGTVLHGPFARTGTPARTSEFDADQGGWGTPRESVAGDFDGDRRTDLVVLGSFEEEDADLEDPNAPRLNSAEWFRGTPTGLEEAGPVKSVNVSYTGGALDPLPGTTGDFDGDGRDDLVVPDLETRKSLGPGSLTVVYGGERGLGTGRPETYVDQDTPGVPGGSQGSDEFGNGAATGDIDGDGHDDLAAPVMGEDQGKGRLIVMRGGRDGLDPATARRYDIDTPGMPGASSRWPNPEVVDDYFGWDTQIADLDQDGKAELVTGAPGFRNRKEPAYWVLPGTSDGPTTHGLRHFTLRGNGTVDGD